MNGQRRLPAWQWSLVAVPAVAATLLVVAQPWEPGAPAASSKSTKPGSTLTGGSGDNGNGKNQGSGNDKKDFAIAGNVAGLHPGAARPVVVTLTNENNFAIRVTTLTAAVSDPAGPCTAGVVQVDPMSGTVVVPGNGTATTTLTARMSDDPANDCKSTTFGLTYSGTAVKA